MHEKNSESQSLQPKPNKPCNDGSQTFSDGIPFVGPVLSPTNLIRSSELWQTRLDTIRRERNGFIQARTILAGFGTKLSLFKI